MADSGILDHRMKVNRIRGDGRAKSENSELNLFTARHFALYVCLLLGGHSTAFCLYFYEYLSFQLISRYLKILRNICEKSE